MTAAIAIEGTFAQTGMSQLLPATAEFYLFRVGQEAIANACQYANASEIQVYLRQSRLDRTTQYPSQDLGSVTITHPFHPYSGQTFEVLKTRNVSGQETVLVKGGISGTFAIPLSWTDRERPMDYQSEFRLLPNSFQELLAALKLLERDFQQH